MGPNAGRSFEVALAWRAIHLGRVACQRLLTGR